jgi:hypothetical protein
MAKPMEPKRIKRIESKLPNLLTNNTFSTEYDVNVYRFNKFKRKAPALYAPHREELLKCLDKLKREMDEWNRRNRTY